MSYYFRVGRKNIVMDDDETLIDLGFAILDMYNIMPDHLFMFRFPDGRETDSCSPLGPMGDDGDVKLETKIEKLGLQVGDTLTFLYNYFSDYSRKVKLTKID